MPDPLHAVFVAHRGATARERAAVWTADGGRTVALSLADHSDVRSFAAAVMAAFDSPFDDGGGLDAAIDTVADLDWLGDPSFVLVVETFDQAPDAVVRGACLFACDVVQRRRAAAPSVPFRIVLVADDRRAVVLDELEHRNRELDELGNRFENPTLTAAPVVALD
ncbi:barstar family protein [Jatrophihabitans fulvus]